MGYDIYIGNRVPADEDAKECGRKFEVERLELPDAPLFDGDEVTGRSNHRSPTYITWEEFCKDVGLESLFLSKLTGLMREHPGVVLLTEDHLAQVRAALKAWNARHHLPPGWRPGQDADKARLMWLEWWMDWALRNCKVPALENS